MDFKQTTMIDTVDPVIWVFNETGSLIILSMMADSGVALQDL